nr:MAG TPA: hypothetical protein [Caudoviricetes sp.]
MNRFNLSIQLSAQLSVQSRKCPFFQQNEMYNFRGKVEISSVFKGSLRSD